MRGVAIFAKAFMGILAQQAAKITQPLMPAATPADLRSMAVDQNLSTDQKIQLDNQINTAMGGIRVQVENYLELNRNRL